MRKNKKGISAVVATVLIILITVAAVTIIYTAVLPMIDEGLKEGTSCFDAARLVTISSDFTCLNTTSKNVEVQIKRGSGDLELSAIKVILSSEGTTNFSRLSSIPDAGGARVYKVKYSSDGQTPDSVAIAAIITSGSSEKTCDTSNFVKLKKCA